MKKKMYVVLLEIKYGDFLVTDKYSDAKRVYYYRRETAYQSYAKYRGVVVSVYPEFKYSKKHGYKKKEILDEIKKALVKKIWTRDEIIDVLKSFRGKWHKSVDTWLNECINAIKSIKEVKRDIWRPSKPLVDINTDVISGIFKNFVRSGRWGSYYVPNPLEISEVVADEWGEWRYFVAIYKRSVWIGKRDWDNAHFVSVNREKLIKNTTYIAKLIAENEEDAKLILDALGYKDEIGDSVFNSARLNYKFPEEVEALKRLYSILKIIIPQ